MPDFITLQENVLHWSVGFINFPLLVVLMDLLPILALTRTQRSLQKGIPGPEVGVAHQM